MRLDRGHQRLQIHSQIVRHDDDPPPPNAPCVRLERQDKAILLRQAARAAGLVEPFFGDDVQERFVDLGPWNAMVAIGQIGDALGAQREDRFATGGSRLNPEGKAAIPQPASATERTTVAAIGTCVASTATITIANANSNARLRISARRALVSA